MSAFTDIQGPSTATFTGARVAFLTLWFLFIVLGHLAISTVMSWPSPEPIHACLASDGDGRAEVPELTSTNRRAAGVTQACR